MSGMDSAICTLVIDGKKREYPRGIKYLSIAREYQGQYDTDIVLGIFNNNIVELSEEIKRDGELKFITAQDAQGRRAYRRSLSFLLAAASRRLKPEYELRIQHSISNGYYCEFYQNQELAETGEEFLEELDRQMRLMVRQELPIEKLNVSTLDAKYQFEQWKITDKAKMLRYRRSSRSSFYVMGGYFDYFYGPMVPDCGYLKNFRLQQYQNGFMLLFPTKNAGQVEDFQGSDKLFATFDQAAHWSEMLGIRTVGSLNEKIAQGKIQDIILVQEALMEEKIAEIAENVAGDPKIKFVMIAGPSSSGKTTFSRRLSIQLIAHGMRPHPISLDNFYKNRQDTPKDAYGELDYEALEALDLPLLNKTLTGLLNGEEMDMPTFNFKSGRREFRGDTLSMGEGDILVLEGIHGLNEAVSAEVPRENKYKIYISALTQLNIDYHNNMSTTDGRLIRRLVRDARTRNTSARETLERWNSVRRGEEKNIFPYQEEADVMFNSALIYEMSVLKLFAEPLLFEIDSSCPEYMEAKRLLNFLDYFLPVPAENIGHNSILREFIGGSCFAV